MIEVIIRKAYDWFSLTDVQPQPAIAAKSGAEVQDWGKDGSPYKESPY